MDSILEQKNHILGGKGYMEANLRGEECRRGQNRALGREFVGHVRVRARESKQC